MAYQAGEMVRIVIASPESEGVKAGDIAEVIDYHEGWKFPYELAGYGYLFAESELAPVNA